MNNFSELFEQCRAKLHAVAGNVGLPCYGGPTGGLHVATGGNGVLATPANVP